MPRSLSNRSSKERYKRKGKMTRSRIGIIRICIGFEDKLLKEQRRDDMVS